MMFWLDCFLSLAPLAEYDRVHTILLRHVSLEGTESGIGEVKYNPAKCNVLERY